MMIQKLRLSFARFTDSDLDKKARQISQAMTGNPNFITPIPTMADLDVAINAYGIALVNAADLSRLHVAEKNKCRLSLEMLLTQLAMYVMYIANGDIAILTSSGFDLVKQREIAEIVSPGSVKLGNGISTGEMTAMIKAQHASKGYYFDYTQDPVTPESVWVTTPSSRSKITLSGLEPGKKYSVRVAVVGKGEQVAYSPIASMFVQ